MLLLNSLAQSNSGQERGGAGGRRGGDGVLKGRISERPGGGRGKGDKARVVPFHSRFFCLGGKPRMQATKQEHRSEIVKEVSSGKKSGRRTKGGKWERGGKWLSAITRKIFTVP